MVDTSFKTRKGTGYTYDCKGRKENPTHIVKWCRNNFGERGKGWDFYTVQGNVHIEIWDSKYKMMYELWKYNV